MHPLRLSFYGLFFLLLITPINAATFSVGNAAPPGFEDLSTSQTTKVDIRYGGKLVGSSMATFDVNHFEFNDSAHVTSLIEPLLSDLNSVAKSLEGHIETHPEEICPSGQTLGCGVIRPEIAGIIFDESKYLVDLFISPDFLKTVEIKKPRYLPAPKNEFSTVSLFSASLLGGGGTRYTQRINVDSVSSFGRSHLQQRISLDSDIGAELSEISISHSGNGWLHSAGTLRTSGLNSSLINSLRFLGVRTEASLLMLRDRAVFSASPIIIFLSERSRVDLVYDGRVIRSKFYEAGNHSIDTAALPNGSFFIELKISNSRGERTEKRLFTRALSIPAKEHPAYFLEIGKYIEDGSLSQFPESSSYGFLSFGSRFRINNQLGAEVQYLKAEFAEDVVQAGVNYLMPHFNQHAGVLLSQSGSVGESYSFSLLYPQFSVSGNYRRINQLLSGVDTAPELLNLKPGRYWDLGLSAKIGRGSLVANYRQSRDVDNDTEEYLLNYRRALYRSASLRADLTLAVSSRAGVEAYTAGITLGRSTKNSGINLNFGGNKTSGADSQTSLTSNWNKTIYEGIDSKLSALAFSSFNNNSRVVGVGVDGENKFGGVSLDVSGDFGAEGIPLTYNLDFESAMLSSDNTLSLGSSSRRSSGVILSVVGSPSGEFDVYVDDKPQAVVTAQKKGAVLLSPYQTYRIKIREKGASLYKINSPEKTITILPGNVNKLTWEVRKVMVFIGRAVDESGKPIANARITNISEFSTTDELGWFQVELAGEKKLVLESSDNKKWELVVPENEKNEEVMLREELPGTPVRDNNEVWLKKDIKSNKQ